MTFSYRQMYAVDKAQEANKQRLLDCLEQKTTQFNEAAQAFYDQNYRDDASRLTLCQTVIRIVDEIIDAGDWDSSLFLRNTIQPLRDIREEALTVRDTLTGSIDTTTITSPQFDEPSTTLYLSLYQADGHDLKKWAQQLCSINKYIVGRPVYRQQSDIHKVLRTKLSQAAEAYAIILVPEQHIIHDEFAQPRVDRLGNELVTLAMGSVTEANIVEFVHLNKHYYLHQQMLIAKSADK